MKPKIKIELNDWHYQCGDGCCDEYGVNLILNGKVCDNNQAGDNVEQALLFVLEELGYEVEIEINY